MIINIFANILNKMRRNPTQMLISISQLKQLTNAPLLHFIIKFMHILIFPLRLYPNSQPNTGLFDEQHCFYLILEAKLVNLIELIQPL